MDVTKFARAVDEVGEIRSALNTIARDMEPRIGESDHDGTRVLRAQLRRLGDRAARASRLLLEGGAPEIAGGVEPIEVGEEEALRRA